MPNILIVDDEDIIREVISEILKLEGHHCITAANAAEARTILKERTVELILCDINMPGETGLEFIRFVFREYQDISAIMVTAMDDPQVAESVFEIGVYDYITKPITRSSVLIGVTNALHRRDLELTNKQYQNNLEKMVADRTISLEKTMSQLRKVLDGIIHTIALTVETRDPYVAGHQRRVADLARAIAVEMKLADEVIEGTYLSGVIHDLGKIYIPSEILSKPGLLTKNEFNLIKDHPQAGYDILKTIEFPWPIAQITYQHHERLDGSGYPLGLSKENILIQARIIAVADVVEAIASHRPYRPALGVEAALKEISEKRGLHFDPAIAHICLKLFSEKGFKFS